MRKIVLFAVLIVTASMVYGDVIIPSNGIVMLVFEHLLHINVQPADHPNIAVGAKVVFSLIAEGDGDLSYQWCKDGTLPANYCIGPTATQQAYQIDSAQVTDNGNYCCIVSDSLPANQGGPQVLVSNTAVLDVVPVVLSPELTYTHAAGAATMTAVFNAHNRTLREMLSSPGTLPAGKEITDVTALEFVFKIGTQQHILRYAVSIPVNTDSGAITLNGAQADNWMAPVVVPSTGTYPFAINGLNGQVRVDFLIGTNAYGANNAILVQSLIQNGGLKTELVVNTTWRNISTP